MSDSLLVATAKVMYEALDAARVANTFARNDFTTDWDFEGRTGETALADGYAAVTVIVPRKYEEALRQTRTELAFVAAFDIDIRAKPLTFDREVLSTWVLVAEQIHQYFENNPRLTITSNSMIAEWIDERVGIRPKSEIIVAYSAKYASERREYYGCCRELFELTAGT